METNAETGQTSGSEKEWDKLLSGSQEEVQNGQKYSNNTSQSGQLGSTQPSSGATSSTHSQVQGDHMNVNHHQNTKLTEFERRKLAAEEPPPEGKKSNIKRRVLKVIVTSMFILMAVGVIVIWSLHGASGKDSDLQFELDSEFYILTGKRLDEETIKIHLGGDIFSGRVSLKCLNREKKKEGSCMTWDDGNKVDTTPFLIGEVLCYNISWINPINVFPVDCLEVSIGQWYNMLPGPWPINAQVKKSLSRFGHNEENGVDIMDYYWLSSDGVGVYLPGDSPYQISWNQSGGHNMCVSPALNGLDSRKNLNYFVCQGLDVKSTHLAMSKRFHRVAPRNISSLAKYTDTFLWSVKPGDSIEFYADELVAFKAFLDSKSFSCNIIELYSNWEQDYGGLVFNTAIFKNIESAISQISSECNFSLTLSPLCSLNSACFTAGVNNNFFLIDMLSPVTKLVSYSNTQAAVWDIQNEDFVSWFSDAILNITSVYGIRNFNLLPVPQLFMVRHSNESTLIDHHFYRNWIDLLNSVSDKSVTNGIYRSQDKHTFLEVVFEFVASDDNESCVNESLSQVLTIGLYGYPYIMSSAKGNINFNNKTRDSFIRWLQLSAFYPAIKMPSDIQFSGEEIISYAQNISNFRREFVFPILQKLQTQVSESFPFVRPLWWSDPLDKETYSVRDEFLLGDHILVAPVLCSGVRTRNIYLPKGSWLDPMHGNQYTGGEWIRDYPVSQFEIPYFVLQENNESI